MISTKLKCAAALVLVVGLVGVGLGPGWTSPRSGTTHAVAAFVEEPAPAERIDALIEARWATAQRRNDEFTGLARSDRDAPAAGGYRGPVPLPRGPLG